MAKENQTKLGSNGGNDNIFEISTSDNGNAQNVWTMISSQVLYQSFANVLKDRHQGIDKIALLAIEDRTQNSNYMSGNIWRDACGLYQIIYWMKQ